MLCSRLILAPARPSPGNAVRSVAAGMLEGPQALAAADIGTVFQPMRMLAWRPRDAQCGFPRQEIHDPVIKPVICPHDSGQMRCAAEIDRMAIGPQNAIGIENASERSVRGSVAAHALRVQIIV